ncbi:ddn-2 [Pristionchus pacificus]|uniref:Uncharacterized protein n=1 Tax=Pristionchus pacificus TaxID=54126 RepID=A0A2A6BJ00_PRIPA|nr:ddn-2 [Pristionchus pacificus]|eukprot:PDM65823.1 hypothetical protein PRIPAC_45224 [Pristionchus pacificus]
MLIRFVAVLVLFVRSTVALNCHVCASRDFLGATIFPVLQSLGASMLIPPAGNCTDNAQICPTTSYCFKREDYYVFLDGSVAGTAHYYSKGCDVNAVAGSTVAYEVNKCKQYDEKTASGYIVRRRICACNDKDLCNDGRSVSVLSLGFALVAATILFNIL